MKLLNQADALPRVADCLRGAAWVMLFVLGSAFPASAKEKQGQSNGVEVEGVVTDVQPGQIALRTAQANPLILTTAKDYSDELAPGMKVTASYTPGQGANALQSIEPPFDSLYVPLSEIEQSVHKVIVLPRSSVPESGQFFDAMEQFLRGRLGWYVPPRALAVEVRSVIEKRSTLDAIDPSTGQFEMSEYVSNNRDLVKRIAFETRVDAVLEATVKPVRVQVDSAHSSAKWDGVEQPLGSTGSHFLGKFSFTHTTAEVPAATVYLKLVDAQGNLLWTARRGLFLLATEVGGMKGGFEEQSLGTALMDSSAVAQRLELIFHSLLSNSGSSTKR